MINITDKLEDRNILAYHGVWIRIVYIGEKKCEKQQLLERT